MVEREIRECIARWLNHTVHTRPECEIDMVASSIGINCATFKSIAQNIINDGIEAWNKREGLASNESD